MRVNICSYLLALLLGSTITAGIDHKIVKEQASASLPCPYSIQGEVTWSREINGSKVDILTIDGDKDIRHNNLGKRFSSEANKFKSLYIQRTTMSDSGRYLCNNEAAVELMVIPSETSMLDAIEGTSVSLKCPNAGASHLVAWSSRDLGNIQHQKGFYVSPIDQTLTITGVELGNSGLYYCDGKAAVYLNVSKEGNKTPTTGIKKTTTTGPSVVTTVDRPSRSVVFGVAVSFLFLTFIITIIVIFYCTRRRRFKRPGSKETCPVYEEIQDKLMFQPTNGLAGSTEANYCMTEFPDGSNYNDPTYCTIPDLPLVEKNSETSLPNQCQYSLIGGTFSENNEDSAQPIDNLYSLLSEAAQSTVKQQATLPVV